MNSNHIIASPWGASVFGAASVTAGPDRARLRAAVKQTRPKPTEAFAATRAAVGQVRQVLRGHGVADSAVSTSRLNLRSSWKLVGNEQKFVGYECAASFLIELRDLDGLEAVLADVVEAGANQVDEVEFDVHDKPRLRAEARAAAVAAAREKAALYARAAGVGLGPVIHITDVDSEQLTSYRSHASAGGGREGDLTPGRITVSAGVILGFSLTGD